MLQSMRTMARLRSQARMVSVAVVGATGAVGKEILECLPRSSLKVDAIKLLASHRSAGKKLEYDGEEHVVEELCAESFEGVDIAFFASGSTESVKYAGDVVRAGALMIDNSSAFRMDPRVPLVVPEVNPADVLGHSGVIANPNCSTIIMNTVVWPLHREQAVERIIVSTYQAASGAGAAAMAELEAQAVAWSEAHKDGRMLAPDDFPQDVIGRQYMFNCFSHNSPVSEATGYNQEEEKMIHETHKIFNNPDIAVSATCVRVPVLRAHTEAITLQFAAGGTMSEERARELLANAPGVDVVDNRADNAFPEPIYASGKDNVLVGRVRSSAAYSPAGAGLELLVSGDQLLKGAALNAVQIAELAADYSAIKPSDAFTIGRPAPADAKAMHKIVAEGSLDDNSPYAYIAMVSDFGDASFVARDKDGEVVGFVMGYVPPSTPHVYFVWQVGVADAARGTGVASALLDAAYNAHALNGVTHLAATVTPTNAASRALFTSFAKRKSAALAITDSAIPDSYFPPASPPHEPEDYFLIGPEGSSPTTL